MSRCSMGRGRTSSISSLELLLAVFLSDLGQIKGSSTTQRQTENLNDMIEENNAAPFYVCQRVCFRIDSQRDHFVRILFKLFISL